MDAYGFAGDDPFADPEAFADDFASPDDGAGTYDGGTGDDLAAPDDGVGGPVGAALAVVGDGGAFRAGDVEQPVPAAGGVDAGVLDELEEAIRDVERALARLDDGSYGTCEACGTPLAPAELADDPTARFCTAHLPLRVD